MIFASKTLIYPVRILIYLNFQKGNIADSDCLYPLAYLHLANTGIVPDFAFKNSFPKTISFLDLGIFWLIHLCKSSTVNGL